MIHQLLSAREVAQRLGVSVTGVYSLCDSGQLVAYRIGAAKKKRLKIDPQSLADYLDRSRVVPVVQAVKPRKAERLDPGGHELLRKAGYRG